MPMTFERADDTPFGSAFCSNSNKQKYRPLISKIAALVIFAFCLPACGPSQDEISSQVTFDLTKRLDAALAGTTTNAQVAQTTVIKESTNKYRIEAAINAYGATRPLKIILFVQDKSQIQEVDPVEWQTLLVWINQQKVQAVSGEDPPIAVTNAVVLSTFPKSLRERTQELLKRLQVVTSVKKVDGYWFGSGCEAHECGSSEAAWAIDPDTAKGYAIVMFQGYRGKSESPEMIFEIFGAHLDDLPDPLKDWADQHGISDGRLVEYPQ